VVLSLQGANDRAQIQDAVGAFRRFERLTRDQAKQMQRPSQLVFRVKTPQIERVDARTQQPLGQPLQLPGNFRVEQIWTDQERVLDGQIGLPCSSAGRTPSYAVMLADHRSQHVWLLVAGMTGQVVE